MRVRWRNFELPTRVICNKNTLTADYGEFIAEPFERGFGHTVGNSLRRALLSAIEGAAITSVKIEGVKHEFSTSPGVLEDVSDIILNVKRIRLRILEEGPVKLFIDVEKKGEVTGADIITNDKAEICNKDLVIATLTEKTSFKMEMEARRGRGYITAEENSKESQEIGIIPVASIFSPVIHVQYRVENTRVGKITNYDRLILTIKTDGTINPEMALVEAAKVFRKHLNCFIQFFELGAELSPQPQKVEETTKQSDQNLQVLREKLELQIETLGLGSRATNCLSSQGIRLVKDLVRRSENELLEIRNMGKTTLNEIKEKLQERNLSLEMHVEPVETPSESPKAEKT